MTPRQITEFIERCDLQTETASYDTMGVSYE